ncbi:MAG: NAD(P)/FAD-dependent oxidoreductase [Pseudomonadota bacterium]
MDVDVAIVGASFAGLSAAMMLARGRRRVVLIDDDRPRNRFAKAAHGFLGQDGRTPREIRRIGLAEVLAYPTATHMAARVDAVSRQGDGRFLLTGTGPAVVAKRIIIATGQRDILPGIEGLDACWGITANQCPYCHGYELADRPTGLLCNADVPLHLARLLRGWTADLTLLENGVPVDDATAAALAGTPRVAGRVQRIEHQDGQMRAAVLEDGRRVPMTALYLVTRQEPASTLAADLGCAMKEGPMGPDVAVDKYQRSSVPGVFAAGDLTTSFANSVQAAASGTQAGAACHQDLLGLLPPREG